jgi:hypothetical protein
MIGGNVTEVDYQVIDKNGKVHNYIWDDEQRKMVEGKREQSIPWWQLHQIANNLKGELVTKTIVDSRGNVSKQIVIEYKEEE